MKEINFEERAKIAIGDIYNEADFGQVLFGYIIAAVSFFTRDDGEEFSYGKTDVERVTDAVALAKYLIEQCNFRVGKTIARGDGDFSEEIFSSPTEFENFIMAQFNAHGISDIDLHHQCWIEKKNRSENEPETIPERIASLFKTQV